MRGLDAYAVGIDWMNLASGALKAAGGGGGGDASDAKKAAEEKAKLEEAKKAAEASASNWKWIGVAAVAALAAGYYVVRRRGLKPQKATT